MALTKPETIQALSQGLKFVRAASLHEWDASKGKELAEKEMGWDIGDWIVVVDGPEMVWQTTEYYTRLLNAIEDHPLSDLEQNLVVTSLEGEERDKVESAVDVILKWAVFLPMMLHCLSHYVDYALIDLLDEPMPEKLAIPDMSGVETAACHEITVGSLCEAYQRMILATRELPDTVQCSFESLMRLKYGLAKSICAVSQLINLSMRCRLSLEMQDWIG